MARPKGTKLGMLTTAQAVQAVREGRWLPLPALLECLNDSMIRYLRVRSKVQTEEGLLTPNYADHMQEVVARMMEAKDVAVAAIRYVSPALATVDFKADITAIQSVIRAPEIAKTADNWSKENENMGVTMIDVTPNKQNGGKAN